jgi:hypothetical protein
MAKNPRNADFLIAPRYFLLFFGLKCKRYLYLVIAKSAASGSRQSSASLRGRISDRGNLSAGFRHAAARG